MIANGCESTWCTDNDHEAAISAHIGRSVLRPLEGEDVEEEEEEVEEEEKEVEEEEEDRKDGCWARMGETWDACARTNVSDRCDAETTRHHIDDTEQRQMRLLEEEEEEEEVEEEEEDRKDGCRARMGETWDACARTNGSDRCDAETTRRHIDDTEQRQMRRILTATLVMLQMHHHGLASTPSHRTPAVSAILKLCSINLGTAEEAAVLFATTTRATREDALLTLSLAPPR